MPGSIRSIGVVFLIALLTASPVSSASSEVPDPGRLERASNPADGTVVFRDVHVLPMDSERILRDRTVIVVDGVITAIGGRGELPIPADATIIEGSGRYLMPGLAEMHAHVPPVARGRPPQQLMEDYMFLYVANGVTTIRGMLGSPYQIDLRAELEREELLGPRFYPGAPSINGNSAPTPSDAEEMMRSAAETGYDLMKIHPGVSRAAWDRMVEVAGEVGLSFGGHVPAAVGVEHALATGMSTIDHLDGYLEAAADSADPPIEGAAADPARIVETLNRSRMRALARETAERGAFVVPTQYLWQNLFGLREAEEVLDQPEMAYVSAGQREAWRRQAAGTPDIPEPVLGEFLDARDDMLRLLADENVVMMGTDSPQLFNVPGFALHREIDVMADAGMTPFQILRSGTEAVGRYLNEWIGDDIRLGRVEEGYVADLVLLESNPLEGIDALRDRAGVMVRGRWIDAEAIAAGLDAIEARHSR